MRDAAISSMALVIFFVDWMERIRRRTSRSCAPTRSALFVLVLVHRRHPVPPHVGLDLVGRRGGADARRAPRPPAGGGEDLLEGEDGLLQLGLDLLGEVALVPDVLNDLAVAGGHEVEQLGLEPLAVLERDVVEVPTG